MSFLTKLFVVLLVVCSMLLTAAVVVFVNRVENFQAASKQSDAKLKAAQSERDRALVGERAANSTAEAIAAQSARQIEARNGQINELQQKLAAQTVQFADLSSKLQMQALALTQATEGQKAAQDMASKLQDQIVAMRTSQDTLVKNSADLNARISDLTNQLEVANRDLRYTKEQLTEAQNQNQKLAQKVKDMGGNLSDLAGAGTGRGAPPISGVIRDVKTIGGVLYATISVGSSSNVIKGMQFNVVDSKRGVFFGVLTVDTVEPNESIGRLEGPRIAEIKPDPNNPIEVRTQL